MATQYDHNLLAEAQRPTRAQLQVHLSDILLLSVIFTVEVLLLPYRKAMTPTFSPMKQDHHQRMGMEWRRKTLLALLHRAPFRGGGQQEG